MSLRDLTRKELLEALDSETSRGIDNGAFGRQVIAKALFELLQDNARGGLSVEIRDDCIWLVHAGRQAKIAKWRGLRWQAYGDPKLGVWLNRTVPSPDETS